MWSWHIGGAAESSGRFALFSITVVDDIWAGISDDFAFEGISPIAIKQQFGSLGSLGFS